MSTPEIPLTDAASVLQELARLPPAVNRYDVLVTSLQSRFAYKLPGPVPIILYVYAGLFALVFFLALVGLATRLLSGSFRLVTVQQGLLMPHASMIFATFMLVFSAFETCVILEQAHAAKAAKPLPPLAVFGVGVVWIFAALAIAPWYWSVTAASLRRRSKPSTTSIQVDSSAQVEDRRFRWQARALNIYELVLPILAFPPIIAIFYLASHQWSDLLGIFNNAVASLQSASPSYDPNSFQIQELLPMVQPLFTVPDMLNKLEKYYLIGFSIWATYVALFSITLLPFFLRHCAEVARLSHRSPTSFVSASKSDGQTGTHLPTVAQPTVAAQRNKFKLVLLASTAVLIIGLTIFGSAIGAAASPDFLLNEDNGRRGGLLVVFSVGCFAIISPFPLFVFARTSILTYLEDRRGASQRFDDYPRRPSIAPQTSSSYPLAIRWQRFKETTVDGQASQTNLAKAPVPVRFENAAPHSKEEEGVDATSVAGWMDMRPLPPYGQRPHV